MANAKGTPSLRNPANSGKQSFLPPRSPFPAISQGYAEYGASHSIGSKGAPRPREGQRNHQRATSESFLIEEQPSWLDDLLNEPETPVKRGTHRRSSSDSFAYLDAANMYPNVDNIVIQEGYKHRALTSAPSWGPEDFDSLKDVQLTAYFPETSLRPQNRAWESGLNTVNYASSLHLSRDKNVHQGHQGSSSAAKEPDKLTLNAREKQNQVSSSQDMKGSSDRKETSQAKTPQSEADPKRVKQQFAQRSRVRKLQYIAELERHVQALQAERAEVSAEVEFLDQQNLILNLENKTLKQRLDSLQEEQLIKCYQHEMLEREVARLRAVFYQQQQPQQPASNHVRSNSRDLDSQFAGLSLKHKGTSSGRDPFSGPVRT